MVLSASICAICGLKEVFVFFMAIDVNDITYKINGAAYEVHNTLGSGFLEKVYEAALAHEMGLKGLQVKRQVPLKVEYKGVIVGDYIADLLVESRVLIELKAVETLQGLHEAQVLNYLKATGLEVGLLMNFKKERLEIRRFINT